jgi:hypothetical protein
MTDNTRCPGLAMVFGVPYRVRFVELDDVFGDHDNAGTIRIDSTCSDDIQARTLLHELAHAAWYTARGEDETIDEEQFAYLFEAAVTNLLSTNWGIVKWCREAIDWRGRGHGLGLAE